MRRPTYELGAHPRNEDLTAIDVCSDHDEDELEQYRLYSTEEFIYSDSDSDYVYHEYHERDVSLPKRPYWFGRPLEIAAQVTCQICLDEVDLHNVVKLSACSHSFCRGCFERFLTLKIDDGQVNNLTCFFEETGDIDVCGVAIARDDVQKIVSLETFAKFEKFLFNQSNSNARQCPHCDFSQLCEGPEQPSCVCVNCEKAFCFTHGNAHDTATTCSQYDKEQARVDRRNHRKIRRISKPCPDCKSPVEKNGGCNHMTCLTCSADFCWVCGQKLSEIIMDHYDWRNIRGCAGQQLVEVEGVTTTNVAVRWLSRFVLFLVVYPIAFVSTLIAMVFSGFFLWCILRWKVSFFQVFRWLFRVLVVCGYSALKGSPIALGVILGMLIYGFLWCCFVPFKYGNLLIRRCRRRAGPRIDQEASRYELNECGQQGERATDQLSERGTYYEMHDEGHAPRFNIRPTQRSPGPRCVEMSAISSEESVDSAGSTAPRIEYIL